MDQKNIPAIVKNPNKILRARADRVPIADIASPRIRRLIDEMRKTLAATLDGIGLAAPQVGASLAIFIVSEEAEEIDRSAAASRCRHCRSLSGMAHPGHCPMGAVRSTAGNIGSGSRQREWKYHVFINPVVKNRSRKKLDGPEGCLSVPGKFGTVSRNEKITVEAYDEHGKKFTRGASGFFARVMQHELDHLDGILFIDKAENIMDVSPGEKRKR